MRVGEVVSRSFGNDVGSLHRYEPHYSRQSMVNYS